VLGLWVGLGYEVELLVGFEAVRVGDVKACGVGIVSQWVFVGGCG
jgi:hypothetical protein